MSDDSISLRPVHNEDLRIFFEFQRDPDAVRMAAFTAKDPDDKDAFAAHWAKILSDSAVTIRTILSGGEIAGHIASYLNDGKPEVTYWIGKAFWGKGIATRALKAFLELKAERPLYGSAAADNLGSRRVLEKCGFSKTGEKRGFANARGEEIDEVIYVLR